MPAIIMIVSIIALIILGPLLTIWAANTLFPLLAIPYAIDTWFATLVIGGLFKSTVNLKK